MTQYDTCRASGCGERPTQTITGLIYRDRLDREHALTPFGLCDEHANDFFRRIDSGLAPNFRLDLHPVPRLRCGECRATFDGRDYQEAAIKMARHYTERHPAWQLVQGDRVTQVSRQARERAAKLIKKGGGDTDKELTMVIELLES